MNKLVIAGRSGDRYIKFKADKNAMKIIKKILEQLGSYYLVDNQVIPKNFSDYEKWKDQWMPVRVKGLSFDIICGDKFIHLVIKEYKDLSRLNDILDELCEWAQPRKVK